MSPPVLVEHVGRGAAAEVVLNRPARRNALSAEAIAMLADAFRGLAGSGVGAVVLRGAEGFFCSGLDLAELDPTQPPIEAWIAVHESIERVDVPVIACLLGGAINAGAALALAADLLVVGETSYLQVGEAAMGMPAPVNAARLALRFPAGVGLQLALTGRRFAGPELHRLGIALDVLPDGAALDHARALGARLATCPDSAAARVKRALRAAGAAGPSFGDAVAAACTAGGRG